MTNSSRANGLMAGKRGLIMGVANQRSLAYGIAQALHSAGAELAFTVLNDRLLEKTAPLVATLGQSGQPPLLIPCGVSTDESIASAFATLAQHWQGFDFVVHAIAYADRECLRQPFLQTSRSAFLESLDISAYSLLAVARAAQPHLRANGNLLTLTYLGSQRVVPNYNVMGVAKAALEATVRYVADDLGPHSIRINALSAGPVKTLAASAIGDFNAVLNHDAAVAPLRRTVTQDDVARSALYLLSDLASGVTGTTLYVDAGANVASGLRVGSLSTT